MKITIINYYFLTQNLFRMAIYIINTPVKILPTSYVSLLGVTVAGHVVVPIQMYTVYYHSIIGSYWLPHNIYCIRKHNFESAKYIK